MLPILKRDAALVSQSCNEGGQAKDRALQVTSTATLVLDRELPDGDWAALLTLDVASSGIHETATKHKDSPREEAQWRSQSCVSDKSLTPIMRRSLTQPKKGALKVSKTKNEPRLTS